MFKFVFFAVVLGVLGASAKKKLIVHIDNVNLDSNKNYVDVTGGVRKSGDGVNLVDLTIDLHHVASEPIYIESEIFVKNDEGAFNSFLKGPAVNICDFFEDPTLNPMLSLIMNALNKFGNKMTSCPISKMKFDIVGFHLENDSLPSFIPAGEYRIEVKTTRLLAGNELEMLFKFDCDSKVEKE